MEPAYSGSSGRGRQRLRFEVWNPAFRPDSLSLSPVVLVHGLSGSGRWWRHNIAALSATRPVYVVDLIGYGANRALLPATIADAADTLAAFLNVLPTGRAHVVGHSMGGHIAATLAARHPARVYRLVLAAASGLVRPHLVPMALRLPVAAHYSPLDFFPTLALDALRAGPLSLLLSARQLLGDDLTDALPAIAAPTLLLWGSRDNLVPLATGEIMARTIPDARLEILEGAGHVLMWDHARLFNRLVDDFLTEQGDYDVSCASDKILPSGSLNHAN